MADRTTPPTGGGSSREHVSRIDRTYFQRPSRFQRIRRGLLLAAVVAGAAWGAWAAFDVPRQIAPGPVAAVHAKWESDCSACHVPFAPIKDNTWFSSAATRQAMDAKCEACHRGAAHHPLQVAAAAGSCASCHADHRGRDADLSRVGDRTCTACHGDIAAHRRADGPADVPPSTVVAPITLLPPATGGATPPVAADAAADGAAGAAGRTVPHGLDAAALARFLETTFLEDALRNEPRLLDAGRARRPLPSPAAAPAVEPGLRTLVAERFDRAIAFTRGTCEKCHEVESVTVRAGILATEPPRTAALGIGVGPARVPVKWFTKAFFNHQPHRGFECRECHAAAYPDATSGPIAGSPIAGSPIAGSPIDSGTVMISGRESCTACHAPPGRDAVTGKPIGGVRFDCVECHRYHGLGAHPGITALSPAAASPDAATR